MGKRLFTLQLISQLDRRRTEDHWGTLDIFGIVAEDFESAAAKITGKVGKPLGVSGVEILFSIDSLLEDTKNWKALGDHSFLKGLIAFVFKRFESEKTIFFVHFKKSNRKQYEKFRLVDSHLPLIL